MSSADDRQRCHHERVPLVSSRWSFPALLAILAALVLVLTPGIAAAEGPGYGGKADKLTLKRQDRQQGKTKDRPTELTVFGAGFRGGSKVELRIGSGAEEEAVADETGALRVSLSRDAPVGTTIVAVGQTPSGSAWTLLGSVPAEEASTGTPNLTSWIIAALGVLGLAGGLAPRLRRARQGSKR